MNEYCTDIAQSIQLVRIRDMKRYLPSIILRKVETWRNAKFVPYNRNPFLHYSAMAITITALQPMNWMTSCEHFFVCMQLTIFGFLHLQSSLLSKSFVIIWPQGIELLSKYVREKVYFCISTIKANSQKYVYMAFLFNTLPYSSPFSHPIFSQENSQGVESYISICLKRLITMGHICITVLD